MIDFQDQLTCHPLSRQYLVQQQLTTYQNEHTLMELTQFQNIRLGKIPKSTKYEDSILIFHQF